MVLRLPQVLVLLMLARVVWNETASAGHCLRLHVRPLRLTSHGKQGCILVLGWRVPSRSSFSPQLVGLLTDWRRRRLLRGEIAAVGPDLVCYIRFQGL